jgi:uncharacterized protein
MKSLVALLLVASFCWSNAEAQTGTPSSPAPAAEIYPPAPAKYFNDYAGITSQNTQDSLNDELVEFDRKTTNQVMVAIFKRKESNMPLADYCSRVFNKWGVGRKGKNNGVVLFVFVDDHLMRITTGWDMERVLPDEDCKRIIDQVITPAFRENDFDGGLTSAVDEIIKTMRANSFSAGF